MRQQGVVAVRAFAYGLPVFNRREHRNESLLIWIDRLRIDIPCEICDNGALPERIAPEVAAMVHEIGHERYRREVGDAVDERKRRPVVYAAFEQDAHRDRARLEGSVRVVRQVRDPFSLGLGAIEQPELVAYGERGIRRLGIVAQQDKDVVEPLQGIRIAPAQGERHVEAIRVASKPYRRARILRGDSPFRTRQDTFFHAHGRGDQAIAFLRGTEMDIAGDDRLGILDGAVGQGRARTDQGGVRIVACPYDVLAMLLRVARMQLIVSLDRPRAGDVVDRLRVLVEDRTDLLA